MAGLAMGEQKMVDGYQAVTCRAGGGARSSRFAPDDFSLWQVRAELEPGAQLTWEGDHGDEALYVVEGALETDTAAAHTGGAIIVESGASVTVRATAPTTIVHSGSKSGQPDTTVIAAPDVAGDAVHIFRNDSSVPTIGAGRLRSFFFSDGACPTCRLAYFIVDGSTSDEPFAGSSHVHTVDEIFHVLDGTLQLGTQHAGPGTSIAIPAGYRYGYRTPGAFRFLNFRHGVSSVVHQPGHEPVRETLEDLPGLAAVLAY